MVTHDVGHETCDDVGHETSYDDGGGHETCDDDDDLCRYNNNIMRGSVEERVRYET